MYLCVMRMSGVPNSWTGVYTYYLINKSPSMNIAMNDHFFHSNFILAFEFILTKVINI